MALAVLSSVSEQNHSIFIDGSNSLAVTAAPDQMLPACNTTQCTGVCELSAEDCRYLLLASALL